MIDKLSTVRLGGLNMTGDELRRIAKIQIIACGTSWHAGLMKYVIEISPDSVELSMQASTDTGIDIPLTHWSLSSVNREKRRTH